MTAQDTIPTIDLEDDLIAIRDLAHCLVMTGQGLHEMDVRSHRAVLYLATRIEQHTLDLLRTARLSS